MTAPQTPQFGYMPPVQPQNMMNNQTMYGMPGQHTGIFNNSNMPALPQPSQQQYPAGNASLPTGAHLNPAFLQNMQTAPLQQQPVWQQSQQPTWQQSQQGNNEEAFRQLQNTLQVLQRLTQQPQPPQQ